MFTGIIEEVGKIKKITKTSSGILLIISANKVLQDCKIGDSIAVNGICLTVTKFDSNSFSVDVMNETVKKTSLSKLSQNTCLNLERAMLINSRFGGHIVSGHIDGIGTICEIKKDGIASIFKINTSKEITKYIINKGSITIDGISLTVVGVNDVSFTVSIIPHTMFVTNLGHKKVGDIVNLENDCIAKYVEKMLDNKQEKQSLLEKIKEM
ncbi:riboflavin synthase [Malacoplasma iowae]|uniref:Riboflavin synthase n=1 Tax=Malacoplasma iowae DK-CPA TaxID=1394179 RepID=A0A084U378_MALIO|nr:riboflavin synthase [Malacoplasma iowae]KFB07414.1 riboflavin synthase, alpha subunit [Malacoplasma iowae DK-CPA]WPL36532.1 riboflavin synthase [Malacoplasma iowae]WPL38303.1 riboflavin synthase [Malacoplasma iowae]WPL41150.1 riboflavin synthase [Malacoplasma iowae]